jgi:hypothetical protein
VQGNNGKFQTVALSAYGLLHPASTAALTALAGRAREHDLYGWCGAGILPRRQRLLCGVVGMCYRAFAARYLALLGASQPSCAPAVEPAASGSLVLPTCAVYSDVVCSGGAASLQSTVSVYTGVIDPTLQQQREQVHERDDIGDCFIPTETHRELAPWLIRNVMEPYTSDPSQTGASVPIDPGHPPRCQPAAARALPPPLEPPERSGGPDGASNAVDPLTHGRASTPPSVADNVPSLLAGALSDTAMAVDSPTTNFCA